MPAAYRTIDIERMLDKVLSDLGPERFATARLLELEKIVRSYHSDQKLPGKTLLRATINRYRETRWPGTGPKRTGRQFR